MMWVNIGSGHHNAPAPWLNVDLTTNTDPRSQPDLRVEPGVPLPFDDRSCERILCSHVLEHVAWRDVPAFLADLARIITDDGVMLVVGPDVYRTVEAYKRGQVDWALVVSVIEHGSLADEQGGWPNSRHQWCCDEQRVLDALDVIGWDAAPYNANRALGEQWPLVGWTSSWQFCLAARKPS